MGKKLSLTTEEIRAKFAPGMLGSSYLLHGDAALWLAGRCGGRELCLIAPSGSELLAEFIGRSEDCEQGHAFICCPPNAANARALREALPWLKPRPLGLTTSAGFGDRLGLATPGHELALREVNERHPTRAIAPIFAQQSIREMTRTRRTPEDVMSDATWGAFQAGFRGRLGADADHLKTPADVDATWAAGFTFFTIDPSAHVDATAESASAAEIEAKLNGLPWKRLESSPTDLERRYAGRKIEVDGAAIEMEKEQVLRAAVKYGAALAHTAELARHLAGKGGEYEIELSVDETERPTSPVEHVYIASELKRLGVAIVSLAPRFVGRFEKGVDFIGDVEELRASLKTHAAIARALGPYKLSLHSGSDKFTVYPLIAEACRGLVHLKTAGTSYLEAVRVIGMLDPGLFREIGECSRERWAEDRATYHVSAELAKVPPMKTLKDANLPGLLDQFDARQVFHVTFGSALDRFGERIKAALREQEARHHEALRAHFVKHLEPFAGR